MFGKNLFEDTALLGLYRELLGIEGIKPFECVGTPKETEAAFLLAHRKGELEDSPIMQFFVKEVYLKIKNDEEKIIEEVLRVSDEHAIPEAHSSILKQI